jgi:hypothetical protein
MYISNGGERGINLDEETSARPVVKARRQIADIWRFVGGRKLLRQSTVEFARCCGGLGGESKSCGWLVGILSSAIDERYGVLIWQGEAVDWEAATRGLMFGKRVLKPWAMDSEP